MTEPIDPATAPLDPPPDPISESPAPSEQPAVLWASPDQSPYGSAKSGKSRPVAALLAFILGRIPGDFAATDRTATATCATDCELLEFGSFEFGRVMATFPDVRSRVEAAVARRPHSGDR